MITTPEPKYIAKNWEITTDPGVEPVTLDEVKTFARIDGGDEDTLIEDIIVAVREAMEFYLGRSLVDRTITMTIDEWQEKEIELPMPPLVSITSVSTLDEDDSATIYNASNYYVVTEAIPGQIVIKQDVSLPNNVDRDVAGYRIIYVAGYGSQASNVPAAIRMAMMQWATMIYETRAITTEPPASVKRTLDLYKVVKL